MAAILGAAFPPIAAHPRVAAFDGTDDPVVVLHHCKHVDRKSKRMQCNQPLHIRSHKRGHLSVTCDAGHQWVWCRHCCDCGLGTRGCIMPAHWMERDSFDTGKRNHMQRHENPSSKRVQESRPVPRAKESSMYGFKKIAVCVNPQGFESPSPVYSVLCAEPRLSPILQTGSACVGIPGPAPVLQSGLMSSPNSLLRASSTFHPYLSRVACIDRVNLLAHGVEVLEKCKHVDRKQNRNPCTCTLKTRNHKRGYLTVICEAGHQWVWCSYCCDCGTAPMGCKNPMHWMERDSFDTGKRNHMQRHLENYDANNDEDGKFLASMAPRQVGMPAFLNPNFLSQLPSISSNVFDARLFADRPVSTDRTSVEPAPKASTSDFSCPSPEPSGEKECFTDGENSPSATGKAFAPLGSHGEKVTDVEVIGDEKGRKRARSTVDDDLAQEAANALIALAQKSSRISR
eukprot:748937-Hanusia_phi.AAC.2